MIRKIFVALFIYVGTVSLFAAEPAIESIPKKSNGSEVKNTIELFEKILNQVKLSEVLHELKGEVSKTLRYTSIEYKENSIFLSGEAADEENGDKSAVQLLKFENNIRKSELFENIETMELKSDNSAIIFRYKLKLSPPKISKKSGKTNNKKYLDELKDKFINETIVEETDLKIEAQKLISNLNLKMKSAGQVKILEEKGNRGYIKKTIPYTIEGNFDQIAKFIYYFENSEDIIFFDNVTINPIKEREKGIIEANLEVGGYFIESNEDVRYYYVR